MNLRRPEVSNEISRPEPEYLDEHLPTDAKPQDLGWIPAFDAHGVPTYWFYADPC